MTHQSPRRYLVINYTTYDLYDTLNRIYYFYQNGSIHTRNWDMIALAFEHLRFDNELQLEDMLLPEPHEEDLQVRIPITRWLTIHGVRASVAMQPIDLTYSDDDEEVDIEPLQAEEFVESEAFDMEIVDILADAEARYHHDQEMPLFEQGYTETPPPLGAWGDDIGSWTEDDEESVTSSGAVDL